jgi:cytochrome c biogenesis protein CcdA
MVGEATTIARLARRLRFTVWILALLLALVTAAGIFVPFPDGAIAAHLTTEGLPRAWAAPIAAGSIALILWGLFELGRMLRLVEAEAAFSLRATRHLKRFAALLMTGVLAGILIPPAVRMVLQSTLTLSLDSDDALLLLVSLVFFLVSRLLDAAAAYQEDSRSIV